MTTRTHIVARSIQCLEIKGKRQSGPYLDPATRHIECVTVNDYEDTDKLFDILMGPSVPPRREYMLIHGDEARV